MPIPAEVAIRAYVQAWNEPEPSTRRALVEKCFAENGRVVTQSRVLHGRAELADEMTRFRAANPELLHVKITSGIDAKGLTFRFEGTAQFRDGKSAPAFDAGEIDADGRICLLLTFPGPLPAAVTTS